MIPLYEQLTYYAFQQCSSTGYIHLVKEVYATRRETNVTEVEINVDIEHKVKWRPLKETGNWKGAGFYFLKRHTICFTKPHSGRTEQAPIP